MAVMDYNTWLQKARANAEAQGQPFNEAGAQDQYEAYKYNAEQGAGGVNAKAQVSGKSWGGGYSAQGGADATGMRERARRLGFSEDFDRFDEGTLQSWEKYKDSRCPEGIPYRAIDGSGCVEKPIDFAESIGQAQYLGDEAVSIFQSSRGRKAGGGPAAAAPPPPPKPVTKGQELSYTGDPMVDVLIHQFNTKLNPEGTGINVFGLGEDRAVGGEGAAADMQKATGQLLAGGGLWWSDDESAFGNFGKPPSQKKKGRGSKRGGAPSPAAIAAPPPPEPTPQPKHETPGVSYSPNLPDYKRQQIEERMAMRSTLPGQGGLGGISGVLGKHFGKDFVL